MFRQNSGIMVFQSGTIIAKALICRDLNIKSTRDIDSLYQNEVKNKYIYIIILISLFAAITGLYTYIRHYKK